MRATLNLPPSVRLIGAALEGLVQVNRVLIETGVVPPSPLDSRVRYKREASGLEEWDNALTCVKRGWGDCEDLNGWECARINIDEDPEAICSLIKTGAKLFHCVVLMSDGSYRDVCPALGMRVPGTSLEGIPWLETRSESVIGTSAASRLLMRQQWRQRRYVPRPSTPSGNGYRPKPSSTNRDGSGGSDPYRPKSSRPAKRPTPVSPEQQTNEPTTVEPTAQTATQMVSPTSQSTPEMDLMPMPMEDEVLDDDQAPDELEAPGEEFDEEMEEQL
jgi:hypothetical protein